MNDDKMINAYGVAGDIGVAEALGEKPPKCHLVRHEPHKI
jgi:hypothetical protein